MITLISNGGLPDKRYICDTFEEAKQINLTGITIQVVENGCFYQSDENGELKQITDGAGGVAGPQGPQGEKGDPGKDGETPEIGTIVEAVIDSYTVKPEWETDESGYVRYYANGIAIQVDEGDDNEHIKITYQLDGDETHTDVVPKGKGLHVYGGGNGMQKYTSFAATSIIINSGEIKVINGGGRGASNVGVATVIVNGGKIGHVGGGGSNNVSAGDRSGNMTGLAKVIINGGELSVVYGGGTTGLSHIGQTSVIVNNGTMDYLVAGGSHGGTALGSITVNGGTINVIQGVNRGTVNMAEINIKGGTVKTLYAGGETTDKSINGIIQNAIVNAVGGTIEKIECGTTGGVESVAFISGTYKQGILDDAIAEELNLIKI